MSLSRDSLAERQLKLILRTKFRLKQGLERLQWEEDILIPQIEALKSGKSVMGLPEGSSIDIEIVNEDPNPSNS